MRQIWATASDARADNRPLNTHTYLPLIQSLRKDHYKRLQRSETLPARFWRLRS